MSTEEENEANVDLKGVIKDLADQIKILTATFDRLLSVSL